MSNANYDGEDDFSQALMEELWKRRTDMTEMKEQIKRLTEERDEARREVCDLVNMDWIGCVDKGVKATAQERGWDCFKEEETP